MLKTAVEIMNTQPYYAHSQVTSHVVRIFLLMLGSLLILLTFCQRPAAAQQPLIAQPAAPTQSWMFRRSYYSHEPVQRVDIGPPTNTRLRYTTPSGQYVRWGWRNSNASGNIRSSFDNFRVFEAWVQGGAQY